MPDVFLYQGEANPSDIKLSDPTVLRASGGAPPVTGTLSSTLADAVSSIAAVEIMSGTCAANLSDATASIAGQEIFTGTLSSSLSNATSSISAVEIMSGTCSSSLSAATMSAAGAEVFTGTLSSSLSAATSAIAGSEVFAGAFSAALSDATMSASGTSVSATTGTLASTLSAATSAVAAVETMQGSLNATLSNATLTASGLMLIQGGLSSSLSSATMSAAGGSYYIAESSSETLTEQRGQRRIIQVLRVSWITNYTATLTIELPRAYGFILKVVTIPDITYPPALNYNVDLLGQDGVDLLGQACNALDSVNREEVYPTLNGGKTPAFACGSQSLRISATGGAAAGTVVLYFTESLGEFNVCA